MASTDCLLDVEQYKKTGNKRKWEELKNYFFDIKSKEVLGRDLRSWGIVTAFYSLFYFCLLCFFGVVLAFFSLVLDEISPMQTGKDSLLKYDPGLAMRPVPDFETTLIRFIQGKPSTYKPYTDHIQVYLDQYENEKQVGENFIDCELGRPPDSEDKVCRFNVDTLGGECTWQKDYGYDEGEPCVILKMNRIYNFRAEPYESLEDIPDADAREMIGDRFRTDHIPITCEGRYDADFENIGNVTFYPAEGFPKYFDPFLNQEGFRSPLVMAKFWKPLNGVVINILCKAWAKNIRHHENDKIGAITFELLVD